ncbi:3-hydroxyacyl-ACP dehydratase FabZ [Micavibrio aeruginosavorus]|uniref:3-hydroxyacyl-[acyl-carrier-protein] dehydratase FabZ n=1 Tax=Micavibrio aeruginosavorus (strain ARL-13) TaxID=856793 RepID=G2KSQ0_MICAA|nr:3-hydroxyacyl-ACP dehydratase FabZ [Micavibrio aeruginosavorus]AEP09650.1 beta-hydroxyacyl-(acyl-carrier-protein) dehydratase FabZ [Micavibrio aeruginosavorus ARL-13]
MSEQNASAAVNIDITRIMEMIPHRYPILLVDRILEFVPNERAVGLKNVTFNEPHFQGHFPRFPVMPGVLIVEAMAQTAAIMVVQTLGKEAEGKLVYFMTIDEARFRKPVVPGDSLHIHVQKTKQRGPVWKFKGEAMVGDTLCAEAEFSAMIMDN